MNPLQLLIQRPTATNVQVNFCTDPPALAKTNSKLIIILDHSGSNQSNYLMNYTNAAGVTDITANGTADITGTDALTADCAANPSLNCANVASTLVNGIDFSSLATDPLGKTRYGDINTQSTLLNYLYNLTPNNPSNPQSFFALIDFNTSAYSNYATDPLTKSTFTSDTACFYGIVQADALGKAAPCNPSGLSPATSPSLYSPSPAPISSNSPAPIGSGSPTPVASASPHPSDNGGTSYVQPLNAAYNLISADISQAKACASLPYGPQTPGCPNGTGVRVTSTYIIVFQSDGTPSPAITKDSQFKVTQGCTDPLLKPFDPEPGSDFCSNSGFNNDSSGNFFFWIESPSAILGEINAIEKLKDTNLDFVSGIDLYTIYYYYNPPAGSNLPPPANLPNIDPGGKSILNQMAVTGSGTFSNIALGQNINYQQFLPPTEVVQYTLGDVFVTNASTTWWTDGKLYLDSDMDGVPDVVELALGSDPFNPDSDGNGVSDFVEYQLYGKPCQTLDRTGKCSPPQTNISGIYGECVVAQGRVAVLGPCDYNTSKWNVLGQGQFQAVGTQNCLTAPSPYSQLTLTPCTSSSNQIWNFSRSPTANSGITSTSTGFCMDDNSSYGTFGNPIISYSCNGGANQLWQLPGLPLATVNVTSACSNLPFSAASLSPLAKPLSGAIAYSNSAKDGLNDCEKLLLNSNTDIVEPDSNEDLITDWLEFKNFLPFQFGIPTSLNVPFADGFTLYQKIKFSLPTTGANPTTQYVPSTYKLTSNVTSDQRVCYNLNVTNIPIIGSQNTVQVDILLKSTTYESDYMYYRGRKSFPAGSNSVNFNDWNDAGEAAAGTWSVWK